MRTLNRPMFRYGGPIKEGVMHGIREPHANGGTIAGGNQIGIPMGNRTGFQNPKSKITTGILSKVLPNVGVKQGFLNPAIQGVKNLWQRIKPTSVPKFKKENMYDLPPGMRGSMVDRVSKIPKMERLGKWARENPYWAFGGTGVGVSSGLIPEVAGGIGSLAKKGILQATDLLVWDKIFDQDKWLAERNKISNKVEKEVPRTPEEIAEAQALAEAQKLEAVAKQEAFAAEQKQKRLDNYRKIMDIEGMTKDAAYNSLIDASKIITDSQDFKGDLRSGKLISSVIGAASKRYDKPDKTRDSINALILKSELEADQPSKKLKDLIAIGIDTPEKQEMYLRNQMGQTSTYGAAKAAASKSGAVGPTQIAAQGAEIHFGNEYKGKIMDEDTFKEQYEILEDAKAGRPNEMIKIIVKKQAEEQGYPPGKYTVGDVLVNVDEDFNITIIRG